MLLARLSPQRADVQAAREPALWDACRLQALLHRELPGDQVIVVSNRAPYIHHRDADQVTLIRPAGGLVTALEPVVRACGGTWIAHGSGNADAEFVDEKDICRVPPEQPAYALRRIWLAADEQRAYHDGFANQGLWPLCHQTEVQAVFNRADWQAYRRVNQRFADAVVGEATSPDPIVLVQDYHFALLPALLRRRLPRATVIAFWHIPWPTPQRLADCPWHPQLLQGLQAASIVGFQTDTDRQNFHAAARRNRPGRSPGRAAETRAAVRTYPISIAWPSARQAAAFPGVADCRRQVYQRWGISPQARLIVGVDRFDYSKGLLERMLALEQLLLHNPDRVGSVCLLQVAAPTRPDVPAYGRFQRRLRAEVARINQRFAGAAELPIRLLEAHHERDALNTLYRAADVCLVTSLHDGMNLVCKEFVAARDDEQGVLVLSRKAGAAAELREAVLIDPNDVAQTAGALLQALVMPPGEQRERMRKLRQTVRVGNIHRWAAHMLTDAAQLRAAACSSRAGTPASVRSNFIVEAA